MLIGKDMKLLLNNTNIIIETSQDLDIIEDNLIILEEL